MLKPIHYAKRTRGKIIRISGEEEEFRLTCQCGNWVSMAFGADWREPFSKKTIEDAERDVWKGLGEEFSKRSAHCHSCEIPCLEG